MSLVPRGSLFDFDNFFDNFRSPDLFNEKGSGFMAPRVEVKDKKGQYVISAELPGVKKEDIKVTLDNGVLTLEAESHQEDKEEKEGKVIRQERRYGRFVRSFNLGRDVQQSDIHAEFKDGVLTLNAPKATPAPASAKAIDIR